ncbi:MAG: hypothetical protein M1829_003065 [Trizodia sp. TS-e1964]|nr:MAG: hypothetical protein M1829_003065 [Trizodia sp. TS-e1964]
MHHHLLSLLLPLLLPLTTSASDNPPIYPGPTPWPPNTLLDRTPPNPPNNPPFLLAPLPAQIQAPFPYLTQTSRAKPHASRPQKLGVLYRVLTATHEPDSPAGTRLHGQALLLRFYERDADGWISPSTGASRVTVSAFLHQARVSNGAWRVEGGKPLDPLQLDVGVEGEHGAVVAWSVVGTVRVEDLETYKNVLRGVEMWEGGEAGARWGALEQRQTDMRIWVHDATWALNRAHVLTFSEDVR